MKLVNLFPLILLFMSCNDGSDEIIVTDTDSSKISDTTYTKIISPGSSYEIVNTNAYYIWDVNAEKKTLKKNTAVSPVNMNADSVINGLNLQYENIFLEKKRIENETIYLRIKDSEYLTNQVGSSGAAQYIAQAVINLTSVPGIKFVHIDFNEGSHASPGTWSRKDFPGYIIIQ